MSIISAHDGFELVPPGIASGARWRAENEPHPRPSAADASYHAGIGLLRP